MGVTWLRFWFGVEDVDEEVSVLDADHGEPLTGANDLTGIGF